MAYFLGIDMGTSYFKAGIFNSEGKPIGLGRQFVPKKTSEKTCELPVSVFWSVLRECISEAAQKAKINASEITSLSYASQANSFLLLDSYNSPLTPLILWPDQRAEEIDMPTELFNQSDYPVLSGLGIVPGSQFCIAKLNWFQKMKPQIWARARRVMSISDYLVFSLTGKRVSDYSTSVMTGLFHMPGRSWSDEATRLFHIEHEYLSRPMSVGTRIGHLTPQGARLAGLNPCTVFYLGGLDHHIAAVGAGLPVFNRMSESTGTTLACVSYKKDLLCESQVNNAPGLDHKHYFRMVFCENGAAALEWYQKTYAPEFSLAELLEKAAGVDIGCEGLIANPCSNHYSGKEGFKNIRNYHGHGHFVRSILESTALSLKRNYSILNKGQTIDGVTSTGGGAKNLLWTEIKADLLGKTFYIPECCEVACLGAAMLGAFDYYKQEIIEKWANVEKIEQPDPVKMERYKDWYIKMTRDNKH